MSSTDCETSNPHSWVLVRYLALYFSFSKHWEPINWMLDHDLSLWQEQNQLSRQDMLLSEISHSFPSTGNTTPTKWSNTEMVYPWQQSKIFWSAIHNSFPFPEVIKWVKMDILISIFITPCTCSFDSLQMEPPYECPELDCQLACPMRLLSVSCFQWTTFLIVTCSPLVALLLCWHSYLQLLV